MTQAIRMLMSGGGTGGHIYPALAVAEALQTMAAQTNTPLTLTFVGNRYKSGATGSGLQPSLEATLAGQHHLAFEGLDFRGMPRGKNLSTLVAYLRWLGQLVVAIFQADAILQRHRPQVVFTTGGYVTAPLLMAATLRQIPYVIHEPDARPGLVNWLMGRWACELTSAFDLPQQALKNPHAVTTGNPIRTRIGHLSKLEARKALQLNWSDTQPVLLVMGGSQGAEKLNLATVEALETILNAGWAVIHQSGVNKYAQTKALVPKHLMNHHNYRLWPYLDNMPAALAMADLALCRAGSLTLSELAAAGLPSLLVPYPHAAANHQWHNAQVFVQAGASCLLNDADCTAEMLLAKSLPLMHDATRRASMSRAARQLGKPEAAAAIAQRLLTLALSQT
ncbi:MAG: UDP-N-acetylglucosamine--N-acetylmuramyl-(pentapeptide) pyrophosphoryl-undecaprenol N-acetylglucosamine transferase [Vampirovibrionales bacterium]|nr:UDP-N-acetylglucosamine--N-acetylmuramyl-(pentapeptide) pyrophosphoryl-undecaprenol N-acetylglucosamine transferase [Vampirovibrionales bacterium]